MDLAAAASEKFPLNPHIKNRSRAQQQVVECSLELGDLARAERIASEIENWRQGLMLARIAVARAERGEVSASRALIERADRIIEDLQRDPAEQGWRPDRIRARIAQAHALLGDTEAAARSQSGLTESEAGRVLVNTAENGSIDFAQQFEQLKVALRADDFETSRFALDAIASLYREHFRDEARRESLEGLATEGVKNMPLGVRVAVLGSMVEAAIEHGEREIGLRHAVAAGELGAAAEGRARDRASLYGRLGQLFAMCGDDAGAGAMLRGGQSLYEESVKAGLMVDMFAARTLRPIAIGWHLAGDTEQARALFAKVLEVGTDNPNSRPRCDDLVATAVAMARVGFEPDEALQARMRQIAGSLSDPW